MPSLEVPGWIRTWLLLSAIIVLYDAGYCLLRPYTLEGGKLYAIWKPYKLYGQVDLVYGVERYHSGDRFCEAQAFMNLVEITLQVIALIFLRSGRTNAGTLTAFACQLMTLWKTVLYQLYDILSGPSGFKHTGHNPLFYEGLLLYWIPNGFWIVLPTAVVLTLGRTMHRTLQQASMSNKKFM